MLTDEEYQKVINNLNDPTSLFTIRLYKDGVCTVCFIKAWLEHWSLTSGYVFSCWMYPERIIVVTPEMVRNGEVKQSQLKTGENSNGEHAVFLLSKVVYKEWLEDC